MHAAPATRGFDPLHDVAAGAADPGRGAALGRRHASTGGAVLAGLAPVAADRWPVRGIALPAPATTPDDEQQLAGQREHGGGAAAAATTVGVATGTTTEAPAAPAAAQATVPAEVRSRFPRRRPARRSGLRG